MTMTVTYSLAILARMSSLQSARQHRHKMRLDSEVSRQHISPQR